METWINRIIFWKQRSYLVLGGMIPLNVANPWVEIWSWDPDNHKSCNEKLSQMWFAWIFLALVICDYLELDNVVGCFGKLSVSTFTSATPFRTHSTSVGLISLINTEVSPKIQNIKKLENVISEIQLCIRWSPLDHVINHITQHEVATHVFSTQSAATRWISFSKSHGHWSASQHHRTKRYRVHAVTVTRRTNTTCDC